MSENTFVCNIQGCTASYELKNSLNKHRQRYHKGWSEAYFEKQADNAKFPCWYCEESFTTQNNRNTHVRKDCKNKPSEEQRKKDQDTRKQQARQLVNEEYKKEEKEWPYEPSSKEQQAEMKARTEAQLAKLKAYTTAKKAELDALAEADAFLQMDQDLSRRHFGDDQDLAMSKQEAKAMRDAQDFKINQRDEVRNSTSFAQIAQSEVAFPISNASIPSQKAKTTSKKPKFKPIKSAAARRKKLQVSESNDSSVVTESVVEVVDAQPTVDKTMQLEESPLSTLELMAAQDPAITLPQTEDVSMVISTVPELEVQIPVDKPLFTMGKPINKDSKKQVQKKNTKKPIVDMTYQNAVISSDASKTCSIDTGIILPQKNTLQPQQPINVFSMQLQTLQTFNIMEDQGKLTSSVDFKMSYASKGQLSSTYDSIVASALMNSKDLMLQITGSIEAAFNNLQRLSGGQLAYEKHQEQIDALRAQYGELEQKIANQYSLVILSQDVGLESSASTLDTSVNTDGSQVLDQLLQETNTVTIDADMKQPDQQPDQQLQEVIQPSEVFTSSKILLWTSTTSYSKKCLKQLAISTRAFKSHAHPKKIFIRGAPIQSATFVELLQMNDFRKKIGLSHTHKTQDLLSQQLRQTNVSFHSKALGKLNRCFMCSFRDTDHARQVLDKTLATNHPEHEGICVIFLVQEDPLWQEPSKKWVKAESKEQMGQVFDPELTLYAKTARISEQLTQDLLAERQRNRLAQFIGNLISDTKQLRDQKREVIDPFNTGVLQRLDCIQSLKQLNGKMTTLRQSIMDTQKREEANLLNKRAKLHQERLKCEQSKQQSSTEELQYSNQAINAVMDQPFEEFSVKYKLSRYGQLKVRQILIHSYSAYCLLKEVKTLITRSIQLLFKRKLEDNSAMVKQALQMIRDAFQLELKALKKQLKEYKRRALTSVMADELPASVVHIRLMLTDCPHFIPPKQRCFTYVSPVLQHDNVISEYVSYSLPQGFHDTKLKRIIMDTSNGKFKSTASAYMTKLKGLLLIIQDMTSLFIDFNDAISAEYPQMQTDGLIGRCNINRMNQIKEDSDLTACLFQLAFNVLKTVNQQLLASKARQLKRETDLQKFAKTKEEEEEVANAKAIAFLKSTNRYGQNKKRLQVRYSRKRTVNHTALEIVNDFLDPQKRYQAHIAAIKHHMNPILKLLKDDNISVRSCTRLQLIEYCFSITVQLDQEAKYESYLRMASSDVEKILPGASETASMLWQHLSAKCYIIYQGSFGQMTQQIIECMIADSVAVDDDSVIETEQDQRKVAQNGSQEKDKQMPTKADKASPSAQNGQQSTKEKQVIQNRAANPEGDGGDDGDDSSDDSDSKDDDSDSDIEVIDTNTDRCYYCNQPSSRLYLTCVLQLILEENAEYRQSYESSHTDDELYFKTLRLCKACRLMLSQKSDDYISIQNPNRAVEDVLRACDRRHINRPKNNVPATHQELFYVVEDRVQSDQALFRKILLHRWAKMTYSRTNEADLKIAWHYLHPYDKIDIVRTIEQLYAEEIDKVCPAEFKGLIYRQPHSIQRCDRDLYEELIKYEKHRDHLMYNSWEFNWIGKLCRTQYDQESQDAYVKYLLYTSDPKYQYSQHKAVFDQMLRLHFYKIYCDNRLDVDYLSDKMQITQRDQNAYAWKPDICEFCKYRKWRTQCQLSLHFLPFNRIPLRYRYLDHDERVNYHVLVKVCMECCSDNLMQERIWLCQQEKYRLSESKAMALAKRNRRILDKTLFKQVWGFTPRNVRSMMPVKVVSEHLTESDDSFYHLPGRPAPPTYVRATPNVEPPVENKEQKAKWNETCSRWDEEDIEYPDVILDLLDEDQKEDDIPVSQPVAYRGWDSLNVEQSRCINSQNAIVYEEPLEQVPPIGELPSEVVAPVEVLPVEVLPVEVLPVQVPLVAQQPNEQAHCTNNEVEMQLQPDDDHSIFQMLSDDSFEDFGQTYLVVNNLATCPAAEQIPPEDEQIESRTVTEKSLSEIEFIDTSRKQDTPQQPMDNPATNNIQGEVLDKQIVVPSPQKLNTQLADPHLNETKEEVKKEEAQNNQQQEIKLNHKLLFKQRADQQDKKQVDLDLSQSQVKDPLEAPFRRQRQTPTTGVVVQKSTQRESRCNSQRKTSKKRTEQPNMTLDAFFKIKTPSVSQARVHTEDSHIRTEEPVIESQEPPVKGEESKETQLNPFASFIKASGSDNILAQQLSKIAQRCVETEPLIMEVLAHQRKVCENIDNMPQLDIRKVLQAKPIISQTSNNPSPLSQLVMELDNEIQSSQTIEKDKQEAPEIQTLQEKEQEIPQTQLIEEEKQDITQVQQPEEGPVIQIDTEESRETPYDHLAALRIRAIDFVQQMDVYYTQKAETARHFYRQQRGIILKPRQTGVFNMSQVQTDMLLPQNRALLTEQTSAVSDKRVAQTQPLPMVKQDAIQAQPSEETNQEIIQAQGSENTQQRVCQVHVPEEANQEILRTQLLEEIIQEEPQAEQSESEDEIISIDDTISISEDDSHKVAEEAKTDVIQQPSVQKPYNHVEALRLCLTQYNESQTQKTEDVKQFTQKTHSPDYWQSGYKVRLDESEYSTIEEKKCVSDLIINAQGRLINHWQAKHGNTQQIKYYAFSTYFFTNIQNGNSGMISDEINRALKHCKTEHVSDIDLLLVPINDIARQHWLLAIVEYKTRTIHIANTAKYAGGRIYEGGAEVIYGEANIAIEYGDPILKTLESFSHSKNKLRWVKGVPVVQQDNAYDCGVFVMIFMAALAITGKVLTLTDDSMLQILQMSSADKRAIVKDALKNSYMLNVLGKQKKLPQQVIVPQTKKKQRQQVKRSVSQRNQGQVKGSKHNKGSKRQKTHTM